MSELVSRAMVARPKSVIRAFPDSSTMIFDYGYLRQSGCAEASNHAYPFKISVDYLARVEIAKTFGDTKQLRRIRYCVAVGRDGPTRLMRFASRLFLTYSRSSPPGIQSEIS